MTDSKDDRDTMLPPETKPDYMPSTIPPAPPKDAPATLETILAELRHQGGMIRALSKTSKDTTDRLNQYIPDQSNIGERVLRLERAARAASVALDVPERHSLILPTHANGTDAE